MSNLELRQIVSGLFLTLSISAALADNIHGAGATFPATVYKSWGSAFQSETGMQLLYDGIGSGGGIKKIGERSVDFGASDKPLPPDELEKLGLMQFPTVVGGVVPVFNVPGIGTGELRMDGPVLANIFMGKIMKWNDPAIVALNPDLQLPNADIHVIHRSDSSGTTFLFTNYLSKVSHEWKSAMGAGTLVDWKVGAGCRTNFLIPICLYKQDYSIGYMDYAFALKSQVRMVKLKNTAGDFVAPTPQAFASAAAYAKWDKSANFYEVLTNEPGAATWPIVGATFILMHKAQANAATGQRVLNFFDWAYSAQGNNIADELGYVPLPSSVQNLIRNAWSETIRDKDGQPLCKTCNAASTPSPVAIAPPPH